MQNIYGADMNLHEMLTVLETFNQKANKIKNFSFTEKYLNPGNSVIISGHKEQNDFEINIEEKKVEDEAVEAIALNLRFFIQNNEKTSLMNMSVFYKESNYLHNLSSEFEKLRFRINNILSLAVQPQPSTHSFENPLIIRDIQDVFMYGSLAHSNKEKALIYSNWMSNPITKAAYTHYFQKLVHEYIDVTNKIAFLNNSVIQVVRKHTSV